MMICCSIVLLLFIYQWWKWLCRLPLFPGFCDKTKFKRAYFIWNRIFCNITNVFTVTFYQFNTSSV